MKQIYAALDSGQMKAVQQLDGPVMILACAGSGKTTVLLERIHALCARGVSPARILAVTFSRNAALEMKSRYAAHYEGKSPVFCTIHSLCYQILGERYGREKLKFFPQEELFAFLKEIRTRYSGTYGELLDGGDPQAVTDLMNRLSRCAAADFFGEKPDQEEAVVEIFKAYKKRKYERKEIDYDDLVMMAYRVLSREETTRKQWQDRFDYCLIDEFQDTGKLQAQLFYLLAANHRNICVVGDDDQSIYGFRDADPQVFKGFEKRYPDCVKITLGVNYRSLPGIVETADHLIRRNHLRYPKKFRPQREGSALIRVVQESDQLHQAIALRTELRKDLSAGVAAEDIAVLYRTRRTGMLPALFCREKEIPLEIGEAFPDVAKGQVYRDIVSYYRLSQNPDDMYALRRVINRPTRYISPSLIRPGMNRRAVYSACLQTADKAYRRRSILDNLDSMYEDFNEMAGMDPPRLLSYMQYGMDYYDYLQEHAEFLHQDKDYFQMEFDLLRKLAAGTKDFPEFDRKVRDFRESLRETGGERGVFFTTFHGAKGMQWKKVYILSADLSPEGGRTQEELEEERRLFYVAVTRAEDELYISYTQKPCRYLRDAGLIRGKSR